MARDRREERWRRLQDRLDREPRRGGREEGSPFQVTADRLGLVLQGETRHAARLTGRLEGCAVQLFASAEGQTEWRASIDVEGAPRNFGISAEGASRGLLAGLLGEDVETGDPVFDRAMAVVGAPQEALALLDRKTRRRLSGLVGAKLVLRRRVLTLEWSSPAREPMPRSAAAELREGAALAASFELTRRPALERLRDNARLDRSPGCRLRSAALLASASPEAFVEAGFDVGALLVRASRSIAKNRAVAGSALALLERHRDPETLLRALEPGALIGLFESAGWRQKVALAEVLGERGGAEAQASLLPHTSGLLVRGELKLAARRAVQAIELRLGQDRGRISLVGDEVRGALSLDDDEDDAGALSYAEREDGGRGGAC